MHMFETQFEQVNQHLNNATAETIVQWAVDQFGAKLALTCSFGGPSGMVLLDMLMKIDRSIPVLVLDTALLFGDTYALIDAVERRYGIMVQKVRPGLSLQAQTEHHGPNLYARDPDRCCQLRKVEPLAQVLQYFDGWLTGLRRDQSASRADTPIVSWNTRHQLVKVSPLATWTEREVWRYIHTHKLPYNILLDRGYTSIGCHTCTSHPSSDDPRSGRWAGFSKNECGLHV